MSLDSNALPKDPYLEKLLNSDPKVTDVSSFIVRINNYITARASKNSLCAFRGEPEIYPVPCNPFLFRSDTLAKNPFFEKNLFGSMRQNQFTGDRCYLDNAIDAQHGEFPSRLLDVSYNCLVALYFAVTPFYHRKPDAYDDRDGIVFIFFVDEIFSPSAPNTIANFDAIVNRDQSWLQEPLFQKNHKFIDHAKINPRIIAQQGAFILFQGDEMEELPKRMFYGIRIPGKRKKLIREQLKQFFGIHTGSIYPEIYNSVDELVEKSCYQNTAAFTCKNELLYTLNQLDKEMDYYLDYALASKESSQPENLEAVLHHIERVIKTYQDGLLQLARNRKQYEPTLSIETLNEIVMKYNDQLDDFAQCLERNGLGDFSTDMLKISI